MAEPLLLKVEEAAARLGISRSRTYLLIQSGEIRSVKVGKSRLIPLADLETFVERLRAEAQQESPVGV